LVVTLLLAAVSGLWLAFQRGNRPPTGEEAAPSPSAVAALPAPPPGSAPVAAQPAVAETATAAPATPIEPSAPPMPQASAAAPAPAASGPVAVTVRLSPKDARLYRKGKPVGSSGVVITLEPGERRSFEVGRRGYLTRKLVLDGSETDVHIGLRPDPAAPAP
jgi:hypothetical protein